MIAEQDFVLRLRRLHRLNLPQTVVNVVRHYSDYNPADADPTEKAIKDAVEALKGETHIMVNGDMFLMLPPMDGARAAELRGKIEHVSSRSGMPAADTEKFITFYTLPQDYDAVRERANAYVELARASEVMGPLQEAVRALQADDVRGPLTAWSLAQVEQLLDNIDIKRYVRTQPVYAQRKDGVWEKKCIDFYISIAELKRERFPRLMLDTPERLFLELCCTLDRKLLLALSDQTDHWLGKNISLNLSVETVLSSAFARFCHVLPNPRRGDVTFDIHRSDLFLNFTTTRNAINALRSEGFKVSIDGITPSVLPFIHFSLLDVDFYKVKVTRDKWEEMQDPAVLNALKTLPPEKIIYSHCDHEGALRHGQSLGVTQYQGWLIDDVANALVT
jgi:hypothetical protein